MSDLISRAEAIEAVANVTMSIHLSNVLCDKLLALPSAEAPTVSEKHQLSLETPTDIIRRSDAIEAVRKVWYDNDDQKDFKQRYYEMGNNDAVEDAIGYIDALPYAETHDIRTETHGVCSDLISRADAMGAVQDHFNADGFKGYDDGQKMMDRIKSLLSADITETETCQRCQDSTDTILNRQGDEIKRLKAEARPTGEWTITLTDDGFGGENTHLICSVCGSEPLAWSSRKFFRYCPSCGAKMGGGDSE